MLQESELSGRAIQISLSLLAMRFEMIVLVEFCHCWERNTVKSNVGKVIKKILSFNEYDRKMRISNRIFFRVL